MADEYTPTTDKVRAAYLTSRTREVPRKVGDVMAEFDRWLAAHDRAVKAEALREAADAWQVGGWSNDIPKGDTRPALILGMAQAGLNWLRTRADLIERGGDRD